jgi:hypothetical protein
VETVDTVPGGTGLEHAHGLDQAKQLQKFLALGLVAIVALLGLVMVVAAFLAYRTATAPPEPPEDPGAMQVASAELDPGGEAGGFDEEPAGFEEEPAGFDEEPAGFSEEPAGFDEDPAGFGEAPADTGEESAGFGEEPSGFGGEIDGFGAEPTTFGDEEVGYEEEPAGFDEPAPPTPPPPTRTARARTTSTEESGVDLLGPDFEVERSRPTPSPSPRPKPKPKPKPRPKPRPKPTQRMARAAALAKGGSGNAGAAFQDAILLEPAASLARGLATYKSAFSKLPRSGRALGLLAVLVRSEAFIENGRASTARPLVEWALGFPGDHQVRAFVHLGRVRDAGKDTKGAAWAFKKALDLGKYGETIPEDQTLEAFSTTLAEKATKSASARLTHIRLQRAQRDYQRQGITAARDELEDVVRLFPEGRPPLAHVYAKEAREAQEAKRKADVFPLAKAALDLDAENVLAHRVLGDDALLIQKNWPKARYHFRAALRAAKLLG